jgi:hypothetical protein
VKQQRHPQFINVQNQEEVQLRHRQLVVNSDINEETDGAAYETEDIREDNDELKYKSDAIPLQLESHEKKKLNRTIPSPSPYCG